MQKRNVAENNRGGGRRHSSKAKSIGELVLPGGPVEQVGQVSKINPGKKKEREGFKRTSVAVLKYNPNLAKTHQADKRRSFFKKSSSTDIAESPLWSSVTSGTEVYFSGHAIRHLPRSQSSLDGEHPDSKLCLSMEDSQEHIPTRLPPPAPIPQPWPPVKKPGASTDVLNLL